MPYAALYNSVAIALTSVRSACNKSKFCGVRAISWKTIKFALKRVYRGVVFFDLRNLRAHRRSFDQILPHQDGTDDQSDDDEHDRQLNQGKSADVLSIHPLR